MDGIGTVEENMRAKKNKSESEEGIVGTEISEVRMPNEREENSRIIEEKMVYYKGKWYRPN